MLASRVPHQDDLLSHLVTAEMAGQHLSEDELLATCIMLFFGGHETTVNLIANDILTLLNHPAELDMLRHDPATYGQSPSRNSYSYESPVQRTLLAQRSQT